MGLVSLLSGFAAGFAACFSAGFAAGLPSLAFASALPLSSPDLTSFFGDAGLGNSLINDFGVAFTLPGGTKRVPRLLCFKLYPTRLRILPPKLRA